MCMTIARSVTVRGPGSASARPGPCTRPRSAHALTRREYHPPRQTPGVKLVHPRPPTRPAGTVLGRAGGLRALHLDPGSGRVVPGTRVGRSALRAAAPAGRGRCRTVPPPSSPRQANSWPAARQRRTRGTGRRRGWFAAPSPVLGASGSPSGRLAGETSPSRRAWAISRARSSWSSSTPRRSVRWSVRWSSMSAPYGRRAHARQARAAAAMPGGERHDDAWRCGLGR